MSERRFPIGALQASLGVLALCASLPAGAQALSEDGGETVVVTAERRAKAENAVPSNSAALSREAIEFIGAQVPGEALNRLPGVAIHRNNGLENLPAIRSPVLNGGQSAGSFLVLEDGVPIRAPGFSNVNQLWETSLDFAERVEVVRGPGSALYGSNAVHGLVNVLTPSARGGEDWAGASADSIGRAGAGLLFSGGGAYLGAHAEHEDGWRSQSGLDRQSALLGWDGGSAGWDTEARLALQNLNQETAGFVVGTDAYKDEELSRANPSPGAYRDTQLARARVTLERNLGSDWSLRLTPYARWIDADLNLSFLPSQAQELSTQAGGGLQSTLYWDPSAAFSLILGVDVDRTRGELYELQSLPNLPNGYVQGLHYDYSVDMSVAALYAQADWGFAEDWRLVAGLRGEQVSYDYDNRAPDGDVGRFRRVADREDDFEALTPKLGLIWTPTDNGAFWLNLARGARPPQITDLYSLQTTQDPGEQEVETIDSAELGWRRQFGTARVEAALYHMDKRDTSFRNADGFNVTGAATRHQGVELSAEAAVSGSVSLAGWITYARHTYRFSDLSGRAGESIHAGDDIDSAPRWIWNARVNWRPVSAARIELEWAHMGEYFINADNSRDYPGHDVLNLRARWLGDDGVEWFGAVRNLADVHYAERADFSFGNDRYFPGEPLGVSLGVRVRH